MSSRTKRNYEHVSDAIKQFESAYKVLIKASVVGSSSRAIEDARYLLGDFGAGVVRITQFDDSRVVAGLTVSEVFDNVKVWVKSLHPKVQGAVAQILSKVTSAVDEFYLVMKDPKARHQMLSKYSVEESRMIQDLTGFEMPSNMMEREIPKSSRARRERHPIYGKTHNLHPVDVAVLRNRGIDPSSDITEEELNAVRNFRIPSLGDAQKEDHTSILETKAAVEAFDDIKKRYKDRMTAKVGPEGITELAIRDSRDRIEQELSQENDDLITRMKKLLKKLDV